MGQVLSVLLRPLRRKRSPDCLGDSDKPPKKRRLLTASPYVYRALFQGQKDSDVAVRALEKDWHLHKVYLCQNPYFDAMFNGTRREAHEQVVRIEILDDQITVDSLDAVFGSMYSEVVEVEPRNVVPVLATATLFHMDEIVDQCVELMLNTISQETASRYYDAARRYAVPAVEKATFQWFQVNLMRLYRGKPNLLRHVSTELMTALAASPDLHVLLGEYSVYSLLRRWVFLRLHPDYDPEDPVRQAEALGELERIRSAGVETYATSVTVVERTYFSGRGEERSFLATPEGQPYVGVFQKLRTQYLTNHHLELQVVFSDNIIPRQWLYGHLANHWDALLRVDQGEDPCSSRQVSDEEFFRTCMRYGRLVVEPLRWRWVDFKLGMDLVLALDHRSLSIRRHHRHRNERMLSLKATRQIMIRATVSSVNARQHPVLSQSSGVCSLSLAIGENVPILSLDPKQAFPMVVLVNWLLVAPPPQGFKEVLLHSQTPTAVDGVSEMGTDCERPMTPTWTHFSGSWDTS